MSTPSTTACGSFSMRILLTDDEGSAALQMRYLSPSRLLNELNFRARSLESDLFNLFHYLRWGHSDGAVTAAGDVIVYVLRIDDTDITKDHTNLTGPGCQTVILRPRDIRSFPWAQSATNCRSLQHCKSHSPTGQGICLSLLWLLATGTPLILCTLLSMGRRFFL